MNKENLQRLAGILKEEKSPVVSGAVRDIFEEVDALRKFVKYIPANQKDNFDDRLDSIKHHAEDIKETIS